MTASKSNRNLQTKKWEKDRRERLNESFNALAKLLPCYEPSVSISKIEILTKSAEYIKKLKNNVNVDDTTRKECDEIKELHVRVSHLTTRNEQLSNLLKDANITIPTECGGLITEKPKKWSGKISAEKAEEIEKTEAQKENNNKITKNQRKTVSKLKGKEKPIKLEEKKKKSRRKPNNLKDANKMTPISGASTLTITNVQPIQPYYIIANNIASTITTQATTVKNVISTPILSTTNCPVNKQFTNGIILPVVQPQTLLNPPLLLNTSGQGNTVYVVKANKVDQNMHGFKPLEGENCVSKTSIKDVPQSKKKLPLLKPKRRVFTRIGNKLPIPPSKYDSSSLIIWSGVGATPVTVKKRKAVKRKQKQTEKTKVVDPQLPANKQKQKIDVSNDQDSDKTNKNSDYSINALCKENSSPMCNEIENVINEVVEKSISIKTTKTNELQTIETQTLRENTQSEEKTQLLNDKQHNIEQSVAKTENHLQTEKVLPLVTQNCDLPNKLDKIQGQTSQTQIVQQQTCFTQVNLQNTNSSQMLNLKQVTVKSMEQSSQNQSQNSQIQQQNPILHNQEQHQASEELNLHSELSNDIFASLQVQGSQNPESTSPTAAFLNAFPLVSSFTGVKVTEVLEDETTDSPHGTPTLLQIGNMEAHNQKTLPNTDNLTPNMINLDNFNFFNNTIYNNFDSIMTTSANLPATTQILTNTMSVMSVPNNKEVKDKMAAVNPPQREKVMFDSNLLSNNDVKNYRHINVKKQVKTSTNSNNTVEKPFYNSVNNNNTNNNTNSVSAPSTIAQSIQTQPFYESQVSSRAVVSSGINFNSAKCYNEYNTFNPFELPKTTQSFTVKGYESYSNNCNYNYQSTDYNYQLKNNYNYDVNVNNCNFYNSTNGNGNNNVQLTQQNNNQTNNTNTNTKYKKTKEQNKQMVNWMAPDFGASGTTSTAAKVTSYSDIGQLGQNGYLYGNDYQNSSSLHTTMEHQSQEHQFPWSPTKLPQLLDSTQHFPPSTLPTLVGDLALGIGNYSGANVPQSKQKNKKSNQYEGNILSVSQLVDGGHGKETAPPARIINRRNSGNRSNKSQAATKNPVKRHKDKDKSAKVCPNDWETSASPTKRNKSTINYSAESLIAAKSQQNYPKTIPPYLPDNILPYFPHNIDDNFTHPQSGHNQSYQNNFTGNYNNSFMPASTSTTYLPSSNFIPELFDNPVENIFSHVNTTKIGSNHAGSSGTPQKTKISPQKTKEGYVSSVSVASHSNGCVPNVGTGTTSTPLKSKRKKEGFVDLSFLSMPSINSPLLPEDFHGSFLPPPPNPNQLYTSCKNPIYKQGTTELASLPIGSLGGSGVAPAASGVISGVVPGGVPVPGARAIQHPEISPAPGSLTNFNLCTIFPEINRTNTVVPDVFRNYGNNSGQKSSNFLPNLE